MKVKVLVDLKIVCEPPRYVVRYANTLEKQAQALEEWCREFEEWVRDHRSQDPVFLGVDREYQEQCSFCVREWEEDTEGCPLCCDAAHEEWDAQHKVEVE